MKDRYDFSKGKRGRVVPAEPEPEGKVRITIRLDQDIVERFFQMAEASGGATGYQTLINAALQEYLDGRRHDSKIRYDGSFARNSSRARRDETRRQAMAAGSFVALPVPVDTTQRKEVVRSCE